MGKKNLKRKWSERKSLHKIRLELKVKNTILVLDSFIRSSSSSYSFHFVCYLLYSSSIYIYVCGFLGILLLVLFSFRSNTQKFSLSLTIFIGFFWSFSSYFILRLFIRFYLNAANTMPWFLFGFWIKEKKNKRIFFSFILLYYEFCWCVHLIKILLAHINAFLFVRMKLRKWNNKHSVYFFFSLDMLLLCVSTRKIECDWIQNVCDT